jgi:vitamin B12 transporter
MRASKRTAPSRNLLLIALATTGLTGLSPSAFAQDDGQPPTQTEDIIIVNGVRFQTPIEQVGRSVSIIQSQEMEDRQQIFVYDALETVPGLQLTRTGSFGATASISLRGLNSNQTLVVIDGIVLNDSATFGNTYDLSALDTADIDRIEVLRGSQATLYGSDAIGGVINIITKDGDDAAPLSLLAEGGSFNTWRGVAGLAGGTDTLSGRVTLSYLDTDGFSSADAANGNTEKDGFETLTLSGKGVFQPTETVRIETTARYIDAENEFDDFDNALGPVDGTPFGLTDTLSLGTIATLDLLEGRVQNRLAVTYLDTERENTTTAGVVDFSSAATRLSTELSTRVQITDPLTIIIGAELDQQESIVSVGFGGNQDIDTVGLFALAQVTPIDGLTLNVGLREDSSDDFGEKTSISLSGAYTVAPTRTILRASFAEGFRAPTAAELSFNPDLFAEESEGWDVSVEQPLLDDRVRISATWFDQQVDQLIAFDLNAFTFANVQKFSSEGLELALQAALSPRLDVAASYTYTDAVNLSTTLAANNLPEHRATMDVTVRPTDRSALSLGVKWNGEENQSGRQLDDYVVVNLRGSYDLSEQLRLFGRIDNLLDENYQDNIGYGTAPASAYLGLQFRY